MSHYNEVVDTCCASCGIAKVDDIKLVPCDDCDLVKYCSDDCKKDHKSEHKEDCKKRAAELHDKILFKQPEGSHLGDCPICMIPLSLDISKSTLTGCCSKVICDGCDFASELREFEARVKGTCPFCRDAAPSSNKEYNEQRRKRIEANDPLALYQHGGEQCRKGNYSKALKLLKKAAELGDADAHYSLSGLYHEGHGVEQNEGKEIHHLEQAAIAGHPTARYILGSHEWNNGHKERAVKHWIIAATQGEDESIKMLMRAFKQGIVEKDVLAAAFRAHKAAVDATKSPQREAARRNLFG